ncbi:glycoside hydrolase family 2 protein [soil metagenome]
MARVVAVDGQTETLLNVGWRLALSEAGACATPNAAEHLTDWIPAQAPGTTARALREAGRFDIDQPTPLHVLDVWWRLDLDETGPCVLRFDGLATLAEVWLGEALVLRSRSMFVAETVEIDLVGAQTLWLCFRALTDDLARKLPRARWRPRMIPSQGLRGLRTTLLGQMPGWTPAVDAVGPWRPISCIRPGPARVVSARIGASLDADGTGRLSARLRIEGGEGDVVLHCAGRTVRLTAEADGVHAGLLEIEDVAAWWPHTHGLPVLHDVAVTIGDLRVDLGRTGFRRIELDQDADGEGFGLRINGEPVFCRGACWTSPDIVGLPGGRADYEPWLKLAREAGMNMLRMSGTGAYESPDFFALCDALGLLVWQDFMFANFDYPIDDPAFATEVAREVDGFLDAIQLSPSLAVLCGGSEVRQQATMMGLKPHMAASALHDAHLPEAAAHWRPDVIYVPSSPHGAPLPFMTDSGVTHYFGVGAYRRPLEDARRAEVRFAAECLAFANIPQVSTLSIGLAAAPGEPLWKARTPRDLGADWDFEDVRDHYLALLHDLDPTTLRRENPALYLDLSRVVTGEVMEATFAEWRRRRSPCRGALVWTLQDLTPGAGWGVIDSLGEPKPAWYALKRAFRPLHLAITDEGCNGLAIHLANETTEPLSLRLELTCLREGVTPVVSVSRDIDLAARATLEISAFQLIGAFFDISRAYRFGPPGHDATVVRLRSAGSETVVAEAFHFPTPATVQPAARVEARLDQTEEGWTLTLLTDTLIRFAHIDLASHRPEDDWFHLSPGAPKTVRLSPRDPAQVDQRPSGRILVPGGRVIASFE